MVRHARGFPGAAADACLPSRAGRPPHRGYRDAGLRRPPGRLGGVAAADVRNRRVDPAALPGHRRHRPVPHPPVACLRSRRHGGRGRHRGRAVDHQARRILRPLDPLGRPLGQPGDWQHPGGLAHPQRRALPIARGRCAPDPENRIDQARRRRRLSVPRQERGREDLGIEQSRLGAPQPAVQTVLGGDPHAHRHGGGPRLDRSFLPVRPGRRPAGLHGSLRARHLARRRRMAGHAKGGKGKHRAGQVRGFPRLRVDVAPTVGRSPQRVLPIPGPAARGSAASSHLDRAVRRAARTVRHQGRVDRPARAPSRRLADERSRNGDHDRDHVDARHFRVVRELLLAPRSPSGLPRGFRRPPVAARV